MAFAEEVSVCACELRRRYHGVCGGGLCVSALRRPSFNGVRREGVCVSALWCRNFFAVCRVCV